MLLSRWTEFAQSALALPDDAEGRAWKRIVPDIIGLQAVTMALNEADDLPADERALAVDRSRVLVDRYSGHIRDAFADKPLHPMLEELVLDAWSAVKQAELLSETSDETPS